MFFRKEREALYHRRFSLLSQKYVKQGLITEFEDELWERLDKACGIGFPASWELKYFKPLAPFQPGKCYERSLMITLGFDDATLVKGDIKSLKYRTDQPWHYWVEHDGYVYEPTTLIKFKKEAYYNLYKPTDVIRFTPEEYMHDDYLEIRNRTVEDFKTSVWAKLWLNVSLPCVMEKMSENEETRKMLEEYIEEVDFYNQDLLKNCEYAEMLRVNQTENKGAQKTKSLI